MKVLLTLLVAVSAICVFGGSFEDELYQVETWAKQTYGQDSLAYKSVQKKLNAIYESSTPEKEKIDQLHKLFPNAYQKTKAVSNTYSHSDAEADLKKGKQLFNEKKYAEAVVYFRKAAEYGHALAQYNLGNCYDKGKGVEKDYAEAVKWYRKAAEQGIALAQYNLGVCYDNGDGVAKDYAEAVKWYRKAAEQGYEPAKKALKNMKR